MSNQTLVIVTRWVLAGLLALVLFLALLQPMAGVIGFVALVLGYNLAITFSSRLHTAMLENKAKRRARLQQLLDKRQQKRTTVPPAAFSPSHYLVSSTMDPPICRLVDKESFVVGRDAGCDLRIPDSSISGQHCRITYGAHSRQYYVEDLRSSMGTFVGTKRLEANSPEKLFDEAEIFISNVRFTFTRSAGSMQPSGGAQQEPIPGQVPGGEYTTPDGAGLMLTISISHGDSTQVRTAVVNAGYVIGRGAQCALMLPGDPYVGRRHAALSVRDGVVHVTDLESRNGTFLGERRLPAGQPTPITNGDMLRIGRHYIQITY